MRAQDLADEQLGEYYAAINPQDGEPARRTSRTSPEDLKVEAISAQLLDELEELYPNRCADPNDSNREIWMKAGEQRILAFLRDQYELASKIED